MFAVLYPVVVLQPQVSQSTGQDLVAFQVHPADIPRKFQQYFKFDRPSSLIQQKKPPGHKFTLAQGLVLYYFSSARKWTNCAIVPMRPCDLRMLYLPDS